MSRIPRLIAPATAILILGVVCFISAARADFATPFVEINNKVGDVSTAHGYIVSLGDENAKHFLVIVETDTAEYDTIRATAAAGIVPAQTLGRHVIVKAKVTDRREHQDRRVTVELEILEVTLPPEKIASRGAADEPLND